MGGKGVRDFRNTWTNQGGVESGEGGGDGLGRGRVVGA